MADVKFKIVSTCELWLAALDDGSDLTVIPDTDGQYDLRTQLDPGSYVVSFAAFEIPQGATATVSIWTRDDDRKDYVVRPDERRMFDIIEFLITTQGDVQ